MTWCGYWRSWWSASSHSCKERAQYQYTIEREVLANQEVMTIPATGGARRRQGVLQRGHDRSWGLSFLHVTLVNTQNTLGQIQEFWAQVPHRVRIASSITCRCSSPR